MVLSNEEGLFVGPLATVHNAPTVLKQPWTREELRLAIKLLKLKKPPDETVLTAELLKAASEKFLAQTLSAFNSILESARIPDMWNLPPSECSRKNCGPFTRLTSNLLQAVDFSTRYLGI